MRNLGCLVAAVVLAGIAVLGWLGWGWWGASSVDEEVAFTVPSGATLTAVAEQLEEQEHIASADAFLLRARIFGSSDPIKAGEFMLAAGASPATILDTFQHGDAIAYRITIPEGTPSVIVHDMLMAEELLTGEIPVPEEGSVLPATYDFVRGEERIALLARMQRAMDETLAELWPNRGENTVATTPEEAVILASIVEKETGVPEEREMVAGLYSNRIRQGIRLQADPTIIYPITRGRPLGRRILRSEIDALNDYNTYQMSGLPRGPITNPGRESIAAVLNPAETDAIFMVADGTGGHVFSVTNAEHEAARERWFEIRRRRGEM